MNGFWSVVKMYKNKNSGSIPILTDLAGILQKNFKTKFAANRFIGLRDVRNLISHSDI